MIAATVVQAKPVTSKDRREFYTTQFKESFAQSRHLEMLRARHMGFFFTVMIASFGVGASVLRDRPLDALHGNTLFVLVLWIWILDLLSLLVLTSVKKLGHAHAIHSRFIKWTREQLINDRDTIKQMLGSFGDQNPLSRSRLLSVQFTNEAVIIVAMIGLDVLLLISMWLGKTQGKLDAWQLAILITLSAPVLFLQGKLYRLSWVTERQGVATAQFFRKESNE
jgi:hypothetical protein